MIISGFTYVRNGFEYQYPFIESIRSLLPIVDELIVVVGDCSDRTREAIIEIGDVKIKIIDSVWDDELRIGGQLFAEQANIGIDRAKGDWLIHLQADEVLMEDCKREILESIKYANSRNEIDGILFPFLHFWGDYSYIRNSRRTHRNEIRAFKNNRDIFSYRDSQGFRKITTNRKEKKLKVIKTKTEVFHYSYSRHPELMKKKSNYFKRFWHTDSWIRKETNNNPFDFNSVDKLELYHGNHPKYMQKTIANKNWDFEYDSSKSNMKIKDRILDFFERLTGYRLFEYKNYILIKRN